jgi:tetratricopeptide (TPR) repeat protein
MSFSPGRLASCLLLATSIAACPQDHLLQHYKAAETFSEKGDQALAVAEYRIYLSQALRRLGNGQGQLRDFQAGKESFEEAASFAPNDPALALDRASASLQVGDLPAAKSFAEQSLASDRGNPRAQWILGRTLFQQGDYSAAKPHLEAAVVAAPGLDVGYALGVTYLKLKDAQHARLLFADILKGLGDTPEIHVLISRAYEEVWAWPEAIQQLTTGIARHPKAPQLHYFLGLAYATRDEAGDNPRAIHKFRAELEINPQDARSHYMLGYELLKQHELTGAESELRRATSLEPDSPDAFIDLAQLYMESHRLSEAEAAARKAITLTQDEPRNDFQIHRAYYLLGRILQQTGHNEEGREQLAISQRLRTKRLARQRARQDGTLAASDFESHAASVSVEDRSRLARLIDQLKPAIANAYNNLGVAAATQQDFPGAANYFQKAAGWNPALETVDRNWGMAEFYGKQYPAAIAPLERHLAAHPDDTRARAALGLSYFTVEDYSKTLSTLQPVEDTAQSDAGLASAYGMSLVKA